MNPADVEQSVLKCLAVHYGLEGALERLSGENLNYLLTLESGDRFVVKIVDEDMPAAVVAMESEALKYAQSSGFGVKLPNIVENRHKKIETGIEIRKNERLRLRLIDFIKGDEIENIADISTDLMKKVGKTIAEFDQAMKGFTHAAAHRSHRWDLAEAGQHRDKISLVENPDKRLLLQWGFDQWTRVKSALRGLPWQVIHGDLNRENILVHNGRISGLVDFGDSCFNPTVCDLAIALAYFMMDQEHPFQSARILIDGYEEIRVLEAPEKSVLMPLVCGRLAVSVAISHQRRKIDPDNPNWFSSEQAAWRLLGQIRETFGEGRGFP